MTFLKVYLPAAKQGLLGIASGKWLMDKTTPLIQADSEEFEGWYAELQAPFEVIEYLNNNLVSSVDNRERAIHSWYSLKESYSADLPLWAIQHVSRQYTLKIKQVFDPFVGSGTTGIALAQQGIDVDGLEYNPFIHFVSETKSYYPVIARSAISKAIASL